VAVKAVANAVHATLAMKGGLQCVARVVRLAGN
jgi:hypothetical protein